jgi:AcrR family transcriptional regulator
VTPRPRTVDDAEILAAVGRVIGRVGPSRFTLALLAREVGMAPATLVQRFGSKRNLLATAMKGGAGDVQPFIERLRAEGHSALGITRELLLCYSGMAATPKEFGNHLAALLLIDLADPALYPLTRDMSRRNQIALERLIAEAVRAGELRAADPQALARTLYAVTSGSLLQWAIHREGLARDWLARDLQTVLAPYLPAPSRDPVP